MTIVKEKDMSSTPTKDLPKQRKLSDLRVIDLQRELRSFGVVYDKKDLKGVLVEKLRQALIQRKLDPDLYLFDTSAELKATPSDEMNRNQEEFHSQENQQSEMSTHEIDTDERLGIEKPVQTMVTPPNNHSPSTAVLDHDESSEQHNPMDNSMDSKQSRENINDDDDEDHKYLTIDQTLNRKEDENNNDEMDHEFTDRLHSPSPPEDELHLNHSMDQFPETNTDFFHQQTHSPTISTTDGDSQQPTTFERHEQDDADDDQQTRTTSERTTDETNAAKSDFHSSPSSNDQQKTENNKKINKDQCHLWVSNIAKETHASHLKELFSKHGKVLTTKVISSMSSQWFGYITLATPDDVEKCIQALHETELHGKKIHVDREMYESTTPPSPSKSKNPSTTSSSSQRQASSYAHKPRSDYSQSKPSSSQYSSTQRDSSRDHYDLSRKRPASVSSNDQRKKFSSNDSSRSNRNSNERRNSSTSHSGPSARPNSYRSSEKLESSRSSSNQRVHEKQSSLRPSQSSERRSMPMSSSSDRHRSTSIDKSRPSSSSYKGKDHHSSASSRSFYNDQRQRHEKDSYDRKHILQQQEEEKLKEEQRRLAEERERVKRQQELLERERLEIERTRRALEKEKQEQARELEKQQHQHRRLPDESKHRTSDEKLHRIAHQDNRHGRASDRDSQRSYHSNTGNSSSNKGYNDRSSTNNSSARGRNRSIDDDGNRNYYPDVKRSYPPNDSRDAMFRDRAAYPDTDLPMSSSSMNTSGSNQRYLPSPSQPHRLSEPYSNLPPRGRDMDLPPNSSLAGPYERSNRGGLNSPPTNTNSMSRREHSRERYETQQYMPESDRRARSPPPPPPPPSSNKMRRGPGEPSHWERPKGREGAHYNQDPHKYLPNQYSSDGSSQSSQQQGLWSSAPPSRQNLHHPDLPVKHPYGWQHQSPPGPPSSHDRSRPNIPNNQRAPMLPSNAPPPPPPPLSSSRGSSTSQAHLYNHSGVPVNTLSSSQQGHVSIAPPPPPPPTSSLHHSSGYLTQPVPPAGLVLHSTGQPRSYEPHYVVTQPLPHQRRY